MTSRMPRSARVRTRSDFDRIFGNARRVATPLLSLHFLAGAGEPRLGLAVSRKVDARAVGRNRIKRILRESFRILRPQLAGGDYVVVARAPAARSDHRALHAAFVALLRRAGALPASPTDGTMPPVSPSSVQTPAATGE